MIKRKIILALIIGVAFNSTMAFADPIIELAAPRLQMPQIFSDDGTVPKTKAVTGAKSSDKSKSCKQSTKKARKHIHKKPVPIKVNYDKVSKMIEYGYYDEADDILMGAIARNSKDVKAQALWAVSLAKQCKLDPAQNELNELLKKYPDNSNLHYAQGVVDYLRTTSSNMFYRNNAKKLTDDALKEFKRATELDKNNARAYNALGVISLNSGKQNDAKDYFNKAIAADKTYSMAIDNLGTMDFLNGKLNDAEKKYKQSLVYNTQNATAMYHLAQIAMQKQDYTTALSYLNNALYINSNSPAIYNLIGKAYAAQGNEAAAIDSFKKSLAVKPEFTLSYLDLADIYEKRGDNAFAIEQLKTALAIEPGYYDAKLKIADISLLEGNYNQAIAVYSELVGMDDYNAPALKGLANAYFAQAQACSNKAQLGTMKDLYKALDSINRAISANPQDLELHFAKLKLSKITNQPDQSKIELNKIIQSPVSDLMSTVTKGEAYLTMNDYQNAGKAFDSAIDLSKNAQDDLYLSEIFIYHKQYDSAQKILDKILKNDANNQEAINDLDYIKKCKKYANNYFKSAQFFLKSKNLSSAMEYLSRSLAMNPNNAQAHLILAQLYEKQKNYPSAVDNYKAYLGLGPNSADAKKIENKIKKLENEL